MIASSLAAAFDERLNKRLRKLVAQIESAMGESIPLVCQDWANTKAAYRFFSNDRVSEADILAGHFQSTRERTRPLAPPVTRAALPFNSK
ncbi:transposase DNA-binding-containing protein [Bradyrhizobium sp. 131]|uniref:IS4/Tn5 family transposase DNA-binding protein n=1 Tax=Bradyrhizobium sp. 131 TaxID=2782609 RepID=UPI001FFFFCCE|nr:transposase DNA-binding-containing protein [Bradyrhizobium sp. 131]